MVFRTLMISAVGAVTLAVMAPTAPAAALQEAGVSEDATSAKKVLHNGVWTKKSFKVSGEWSIYEQDGKTYVKLSDDFRTRGAPDLKIFLSPLAASEANGRNATDGAVLVAPLSSNAGAQIYEAPAGVDIAAFNSILIHCEQYSKLWSAADLSAPPS